MNWLLEYSQKLSELAVFFGVIIAVYTLRQNREMHKENYARSLYKDYLKMAFDNPELADPRFIKFNLKIKNPTIDGDPIKFEKYKWLLSVMMDAFDEIYQLFPCRSDWTLTIERNINCHRQFIDSKYFKERNYSQLFTPKFWQFVDKIIRKEKIQHGHA